jgi:hypothetical protein
MPPAIAAIVIHKRRLSIMRVLFLIEGRSDSIHRSGTLSLETRRWHFG